MRKEQKKEHEKLTEYTIIKNTTPVISYKTQGSIALLYTCNRVKFHIGKTKTNHLLTNQLTAS